MSPCGMPGIPDNYSPEGFINGHENSGIRALFSIALWAWGRHWSPAYAGKVLGYHGAMVLHRGWMLKIKNTDPVVRACFSRISMQACLRKTSTDKCLDVLLAYEGYAHRPLMTLFRETEVLQDLKLTILYGENDFF